jgi:hypothetical protein
MDGLYIDYNLLYDNGGYGIDVHTFGTLGYIRNNTSVKNTTYSIYNYDDDIELRNNIYETTLGSFNPSSNNHDNDIQNSFTDYANDDFTINDSTKTVVDGGVDWGQTGDFVGNDKSGDEWDIGAYEFQYFIPSEEEPTARTKNEDWIINGKSIGKYKIVIK